MSKFKVNAKLLSKVFLNAFSLIETVIAIIGLSWTSPSHLIFFPIVYFETVSLHVLFHLSKDSYRYYRYLSCCLFQFLLIQALSPFSSLMLYLPTLLAIPLVLSVDSISRLNVVFTVSGTMTWSLEPNGTSILICWFG